MWWILWTVLALIAVFVLVVLARTAGFRPQEEKALPPSEVSVDRERAVRDLAEMIRCRTVSSHDHEQEDAAEFERFRALLPRLYPVLHGRCSPERIGRSGLLYTIGGKQHGDPCIFMAHYDVVPAVEEAWEKPPFDAVLEDGVLWGRGTLDTKTTLLGVLEAVEQLLASGFEPEHDLYLAFSGDEEVAGESAPAIVAELERRGVKPGMVVDEGGAVVERVFPGVSRPCALIGTGEKGLMDLELSISGNGGHASAPPPHTLVGQLSAACCAVEKRPFPSRLTRPAAEMFDTLGRNSTFFYRMIFANLWCFRPLLDRMCKKTGGEMNALMRTSCAFTCMEGSKGMNVLPPEAKMIANLRLIGGDTIDSATEYIRRTIGNDDIRLRVIDGMNPSPFSSTDCEEYRRLQDAIRQTWPEALVSPYLMVACSDSRHYCRISDHVYRFSAMALSKEERGMIHGNNERIPVETVCKTVAFYLRLIGSC